MIYSYLFDYGILAKDIDIEYNVSRNYSITMTHQSFLDNNTIGSYKQKPYKPTTYEEEIKLQYILLTQEIDDNLTTEQMAEVIKKITGKPVKTENPKPKKPSEFGDGE